jgi:hypothetical protein
VSIPATSAYVLYAKERFENVAFLLLFTPYLGVVDCANASVVEEIDVRRENANNDNNFFIFFDF